MTTEFQLEKKIYEKLDKLDDIIQEKDFSNHLNFIHELLFSDAFEQVFGGRDDEYIGLAFHDLSVLTKSEQIDENLKKKIIEIINRAVLGINGIYIAKELANDLNDFGTNFDGSPASEANRIWWYANGGIAIADLKPILQRVAPNSLKLFDWSNPLILLRDGLKTDTDFTELKYSTKVKKKKSLPVLGSYTIDKSKKNKILKELTMDDTYSIESLVPTLEYNYESLEALCDSLQYWHKVMQKKRNDGQYIFDINEELHLVKVILEAILESDAKTLYLKEPIKNIKSFYESSLMISDGDTDKNDDSHIIRKESIEMANRLLNIVK
jgi:hypothetical protein